MDPRYPLMARAIYENGDIKMIYLSVLFRISIYLQKYAFCQIFCFCIHIGFHQWFKCILSENPRSFFTVSILLECLHISLCPQNCILDQITDYSTDR